MSDTTPTRVLHIDEHLYHKSAVLRTCYWFTDRCYIFVSRPSPGALDVEIRAKPDQPPAMLDVVAGEFANALLDYELRRQIDEQTGSIRELLIAKAVAQAGTLDDPPPGDASDSVELRQATHEGLVHISTRRS
ncbi:His-Xaa-Ser system protein HxsD [Paludibaculum fermentans]|uniref:His-Xaa-Ser system protein HxsD n=1 Tax=Paludibaculum fermentans TaxID=1473598 RepID=UPI003EB69B4A